MKKKNLAIIPCRSGSKGIKNKNIVNIFGKPLIYYTITFAKFCKFIDKVIVSTDSEKYRKVCEKYGVEVPFLRPKKISKDDSLDIDFIKHALKWLKKNENYKPDLIINLRPTTPLRKIKILKKAVNIIKNDKKIESVRSISKLNKSIYKCWFLSKKNLLNPVTRNLTKYIEPHNAPRQKLKNAYFQNGIYDIFKVDLAKKNKLSGKNIFGLLTEDTKDIDAPMDLMEIKKEKHAFKKFKKYIFN